MAKNENNERKDFEEEYQDLLKVSSSMIEGIQNQMENWAQSQSHLTDYQRKYVDELKNAVGELTDQKSVMSTLKDLQAKRNGLLSDYQKYGQKAYKTAADDLQVSIAALDLWNKRVEAIKAVNGAAEGLTEKFDEVLEGFTEHLEEIPLIGGMLTKIASGPLEHLKETFKEASQEFVTSFGKSLMSGKKGMEALKIAGGEAFSSIMASINPVTLAIAAIVVGLSLGFKRFHEIEKAAHDFKTTTGLATADMHELEHTIQGINNHFGYLGVSVADASKYMSDFTDAADDLTIPLESTVASMAVLNKNFGVTSESASKVNKIFQNMAGLSETQAQYMANTVVEMSNMVGVSAEKVMKDIADNAAESYKYFRGSPQQLAKAAVYAARMGTSIENMNKSSEKLLNFEQSISDELEASALIGQDLNFGRARELAYAGDQLGMQEEINKQLAGMRDINSMSAYEKEALVNASGQELDVLLNTQKIYKRFGDLDRERLAAANELVGKGLDLKDVSDEELEAQTKRMASQQEMQDMMTGMTNRLGQIGTALTDMFQPIGKYLVMGLSAAVKILAGTLIPTFQFLGAVIKFAFKPIDYTIHVFEELFGLVKSLMKDGISGMVDKMREMGPLMSAIVIATGIFATLWVASILPSVLATAASLGLTIVGSLIEAAGYALGFAIDMAAAAIGAITTASAMTLGIGALAIAGGIAVGASMMNSEREKAKGSVEDGVIQDGNIISTHPDDFLIATKDPSSLAATNNNQGGGGAIAGLVTSMIDEIRGLRSDLISGKVAVYMDGRKVTAAVATKVNEDPTTTKR